MSGWLITGAAGMLGRDLVSCLERAGEDVIGYGRSELDITDAAAVRDRLAATQASGSRQLRGLDRRGRCRDQ